MIWGKGWDVCWGDGKRQCFFEKKIKANRVLRKKDSDKRILPSTPTYDGHTVVER